MSKFATFGKELASATGQSVLSLSIINPYRCGMFLEKEMPMPIYQTGRYRVKATGVAKVKVAIQDFVAYLQTNEPGTKMYVVWQQTDDPTHFLHLFIFEDEAAQVRHAQSEAVKRFEAIYSPELAGDEVEFTDFQMVAGKR